jgi:hypothetical protein
MAAPTPEPPTPPNPGAGSKWVPSDFLYIGGSAVGILSPIVAADPNLTTAHPLIGAAMAPIAVLLFWAASYAAAKGD